MPATVDLSKLLKGLPKGAWVAISNNEERVIAYSADLQDLLEKAHAAGETDPVIVKVPEIDASLLMYHAQLPKSPTHSPISTVIRQTQALFTPWRGRVLDCRTGASGGCVPGSRPVCRYSCQYPESARRRRGFKSKAVWLRPKPERLAEFA